MREMGRQGVADLIGELRSCRRAHQRHRSAARGRIVAPATLNQGLVRFRSHKPGATDADHDARTEAVIAAINAEGTAFFSGTTWKGCRAMRISVINWRTTEADVELTVAAVARVLARTESSA